MPAAIRIIWLSSEIGLERVDGLHNAVAHCLTGFQAEHLS
jgi:hypothetical protein